MAMYEYECLEHGKFEQLSNSYRDGSLRLCPKCGKDCERIDFSLPAKRNPEHGIQK